MDTSLSNLSHKSLIRLIELTRKLAAPHDLDHLLHDVLESSKELMSADSGSLWLYDEESDTLTMCVPAMDPPPRIHAGEGLVGECMARLLMINVPDCYADPRFSSRVDQETGYKTESLLSIPLLGFDSSKVGVMQLLNKAGGPFDESDEFLASALAAQCAMALQRTQMTESLIAKERLDEEVQLATQMQQATLPTEMPSVAGYEFVGRFHPADYTGGDLYDLVELDDKIFVLLGDATGHGFGPALSATQMQGMLRVAFRVGATLEDAYQAVNNQLCEDLPDDRFLTAFMGFLDPATSTLTYHSGGQAPIMHYHYQTGKFDWLAPSSFPVGVMEISTMPEPVILKLDPGDIIAVISDGIYEYENEEGEQFGEQRVGEVITQSLDLAIADAAQAIMDAVTEFGQSEQEDDITMVMVRRNP